jgi:hypothetical protein
MESFVQPPASFCPIRHAEWESLLDANAPTLPDDALAVHFWNEMWRRYEREKDASYDPGCLYEQLKARYGLRIETRRSSETASA